MVIDLVVVLSPLASIDNCINSDSQKNIVQTEKKLKTFIEVVDQVLVNNVVEDEKLEESQEADAARNDPEPENVSTKEEIIPANNKTPEIVNENIEEKDDVKNILEHESPTQSESRSTRWEALADIAAELPPSLAVDPVTGQIYSLTK
ncbi:uncharacterized protein LOC123709901 isoform X4 [Pieris brassicae]|uniref:uncharacterized protein LOC123709901 isoform X4 n=1 Tax=Pieris brassicae TaxID=7116 RepID=UPI001E66032B|nr:uncharacterized protein LOC123709901 isoform X4 [Pieris brassicae]